MTQFPVICYTSVRQIPYRRGTLTLLHAYMIVTIFNSNGCLSFEVDVISIRK